MHTYPNSIFGALTKHNEKVNGFWVPWADPPPPQKYASMPSQLVMKAGPEVLIDKQRLQPEIHGWPEVSSTRSLSQSKGMEKQKMATQRFIRPGFVILPRKSSPPGISEN